jgi:hypothetical protein
VIDLGAGQLAQQRLEFTWMTQSRSPDKAAFVALYNRIAKESWLSKWSSEQWLWIHEHADFRHQRVAFATALALSGIQLPKTLN